MQLILSINTIVSAFVGIFNKYKKLLVAITITISSCVVNASDINLMITKTEKEFNIPKGLLTSIAKVESKVNFYALNIEGKPIVAKSELEAKNIINTYLSAGYTSIEILG